MLVADVLLFHDDRLAVDCPAASLVAGDLRRQGIAATTGPVRFPDTAQDVKVFAATIPGSSGPSGIGLVTQGEDHHAQAVARASLAGWLAVTGPRRVLLASPRSFCAGVERAIEVVERLLDEHGGRVYVRKQIVHNKHVVAELEARGAVFVDELDEVPNGAVTVFSAHGVSPAVRADAAHRLLDVVDATCPLVTKVHAEALRYVARGDTVVLIGHAGHEEVEGTLGEAPDRIVLVETPEDAERLVVEDPERVSYVTQTTLSVEETTEVSDALRRNLPAVRGQGVEDICYATTNRQEALRAVATQSDLVLVVGSRNSSNSLRLVELAERLGTPAHLIDDAGDIRPEWLAGVTSVGLSAGASAPPQLVHDVVSALAGLGPVTVTEHEHTREDISFQLPSALRSS
ncbi:4-hydroxy-3-methylbut-2-enyl diphosphate reductase [Lentzea sp. NPDC051213]|uniref:4-hydroxy-3-methylbut-2-enyl diphosphate reductase n=1 Tax=Lentzea sp. NPDC051213 TaxID=3364126 RepID=UPI0037970C7C